METVQKTFGGIPIIAVSIVAAVAVNYGILVNSLESLKSEMRELRADVRQVYATINQNEREHREKIR